MEENIKYVSKYKSKYNEDLNEKSERRKVSKSREKEEEKLERRSLHGVVDFDMKHAARAPWPHGDLCHIADVVSPALDDELRGGLLRKRTSWRAGAVALWRRRGQVGARHCCYSALVSSKR